MFKYSLFLSADVLTIKSAHIDHSGLYQCMVKNQVGSSYAVAYLDVIGKGGVPPGGGGLGSAGRLNCGHMAVISDPI